MKNLISFFLILSLAAGCGRNNGGPVTITGKLSDTTGKVLIMHNPQGMFVTMKDTAVDAEGRFTLTVDADMSRIFLFGTSDNKLQRSVFVRPGDNIVIDIAGEEVSFSGDEAENNRFLEGLDQYRMKVEREFPADVQNIGQYQGAQQAQLDAMLKFIGESAPKDTGFVEIVKAGILKNYYHSLLNYPSFYQMVFGHAPVLDSNYYDFISKIDLSFPYGENVDGMPPFLVSLFESMERTGRLNVGLDDYLQKRASLIGNPALREAYLLYALELELYGFNQHYAELSGGVENQIVSEKGKQKLADLKVKYQESLPNYKNYLSGMPAYNFDGTDKEGKHHDLAELKGKVVVVDVWNTGCKPCVAEIPFLKGLEKKFEGKDVVFVSYSLDTDPGRWEDFMTARGMEGNQWIDTLGFKSELVKEFGLRGIPRFMVFGRQGEIVDVFAPRPSDPRLALLLEQELNK